LKDTVYALDSTTIDLCLSVFSWAPFRSTKAAVKLHTLLDLRGSIPSFIFIRDGKFQDINVLDDLVPEPGAFYVMDRAYIDFERLARLNDAGSFFVTRAKSNFRAQRRYSHAVDQATGLVCETVVLTGFYSRKGFEAPLRRIKFNDPETGKRLVSSRTTLHCRHSRSPSCTACAGVWNCFSSGSNSTCESRRSAAQLRTQ
jgi:Transposase DDE domain